MRRANGVLAPDVAVQVPGALLLEGGARVAMGIKPRRIGLTALVAFLVPVSLQMHPPHLLTHQGQNQGEWRNKQTNGDGQHE